MNSSAIFIVIALWLIGHWAVKGEDRRARPSRLRARNNALAGPPGQQWTGAAQAHLQSKARDFQESGLEYEAKLCMSAGSALKDIEAGSPPDGSLQGEPQAPLGGMDECMHEDEPHSHAA